MLVFFFLIFQPYLIVSIHKWNFLTCHRVVTCWGLCCLIMNAGLLPGWKGTLVNINGVSVLSPVHRPPVHVCPWAACWTSRSKWVSVCLEKFPAAQTVWLCAQRLRRHPWKFVCVKHVLTVLELRHWALDGATALGCWFQRTAPRLCASLALRHLFQLVRISCQLSLAL